MLSYKRQQAQPEISLSRHGLAACISVEITREKLDLQERGMGREIGQAPVGKAALPGAQELARAAQAPFLLGNVEPAGQLVKLGKIEALGMRLRSPSQPERRRRSSASAPLGRAEVAQSTFLTEHIASLSERSKLNELISGFRVIGKVTFLTEPRRAGGKALVTASPASSAQRGPFWVAERLHEPSSAE